MLILLLHFSWHTHTHRETPITHSHPHTSGIGMCFQVRRTLWPIAHFAHARPASSAAWAWHTAGLAPGFRFYRCLRKFNKTLWQIINQLKIYNRLSARPQREGDNANTRVCVCVCVWVQRCSYNHTYSARLFHSFALSLSLYLSLPLRKAGHNCDMGNIKRFESQLCSIRSGIFAKWPPLWV